MCKRDIAWCIVLLLLAIVCFIGFVSMANDAHELMHQMSDTV